MIFAHQDLISNWLSYAKSTGELISFGFSDRSVRSLVSAKRSANRSVQTKKKRLHFLVDLWSQSEFGTQRNAQRKTDPTSEMIQCLHLRQFKMEELMRMSLLGQHVKTVVMSVVIQYTYTWFKLLRFLLFFLQYLLFYYLKTL